MRPAVLFPLFADVTTLPGIGPRFGKLIAKVAGPKVVDLLWHRPFGLVDRRFQPSVAEAPEGRICTLKVRIAEHVPSPNPRRPYRVLARDESGTVELVFFHAKGDWLAKALPLGEVRLVSGRVERFQGRVQMAHPDRIVGEDQAEELLRLEPVYPLTAGLPAGTLRKAIELAVERTPELPEWMDKPLREQRRWPSWREAIGMLHGPAGQGDLEPTASGRTRLAYDELLANQLALALMRQHQKRQAGRETRGTGKLRARILSALPYELTRSQVEADAEIAADLAGDKRMLRLLQGDVGSGKTVVALLAMIAAVEAGSQAALMAPTEILARQHMATIEPLAEAAGVPVALLTGRDKGKRREEILAGFASGAIPLAVGTHALVQDGVAFRDLALAVVDEQHRFGVDQRVELAAKGRAVDVLAMTATPIPRTLMLAAYGDLDVSRLTEKPAGRKPVDTRTVPLERLSEVVDAVGRAIAGGGQVFWVCPLIEDTSEGAPDDTTAAEVRHAELAARFGTDRVALVHGRLKAADKDKAMAAFADGTAKLLVATTVIEVGVDVPAATVMVIEHAERFGLAQLHQLRGRIGRGDKAATCLLLYQAPLGEAAKARLATLRETDDGFRIAEEDLRLRGAGEVLGKRQSGLPEFKAADLAVHGDLLPIAADDVKLILARDPELEGERGKALRTLLYLFERDAAVRYLRSG
ncbi:MAG: ATP-dependent DNA helicase RecG [Alphaproteobacteria bacterium]|nr:ATP-dependent DNA helicase RecG [Alphaproteobacteria bacterium]